MFVTYYPHKLYISQTKKLSQFLLVTVNSVSMLNFCSEFNGASSRSPSTFKDFSLECLVARLCIIRKKGELAKMSFHCHSLSLVVTRCTTRCHLLSLGVALFVTTRCLYIILCPIFLDKYRSIKNTFFIQLQDFYCFYFVDARPVIYTA